MRWVTRLVRLVLVVSVVLSALAGARWALYRARVLRGEMPSSFDSYYLPPSTALHYAALGHDAFVADLVWAKSLVYFGENFLDAGLQRWLRKYLDTVTDLDPHFKYAYIWAGGAMIYGGQAIDPTSIGDALHFYEKGLAVFPDDWELHWHMGFELYFDLATRVDDPTEAEKARKQAMGHFIAVARHPDAPGFYKSFVLGQLDREGLRQIARKMAAQIYAITHDPEDIKVVERHLASILGTQRASQWERWRREPLESWKKEYPFVPFELYLLMRKRSTFDIETLFREAAKEEGRWKD